MRTRSSMPTLTRRSGVLATAVAVFLFAAATHAQPSRPTPPTDAEVEARIRADVAAESAEAASAFDEANRLRDANDLAGAAAGYERAADLAPRSSHPLRRLCGVEAQRGRSESALARCSGAVAREDLPLNHAALASALLQREGTADLAAALASARRAFERDANDGFIALVYCEAAVRNGDLDALDVGVARLRTLSPGAPTTPFYAAIAAASRGRWDEAAAELDAARAAGLPAADADHLEAALAKARPAHVVAWHAVRKVVAAWIAVLALLTAAGFALSAVTLRAARRLPLERTGHARGLDAALRGAYSVVLWIACAFYYASIPLVLALVLGTSAGMLYVLLALGTIPLKFVVAIIAITAITVFAIVKSLLLRRADEDPGMRLDLDEHPRLRALLDEVAARIGTRPVDTVFLTPGTDIAVFERGSALLRLRGRSMERCLILGLGVLEGMHLLELKAILAHEYGHFHNEDTAGGGFALAVRRSLLLSAVGMAQGGVAHWYNPAWWFVRGFFSLFLRMSQGASRLQEVLADRWAAFSYGSKAFESGLRHVITKSVEFDAWSDAVLGEVVRSKLPLRNLYTYEPETAPDDDDLDRAIDEALAREPSPYDSHPSPTERFALVAALHDAPDPVDDGEEALSVLAGAEALQQRMTREVCSRVSERTGIVIPDEDAPPRRKKKRKKVPAEAPGCVVEP